MNKEIVNSKGEKVLLNSQESVIANANQTLCNNTGFEVDVTTLTTVLKSITEQKFAQLSVSDYIPVSVGEGAWSTNLTKFRSFNTGGDFEEGIINTATDNSRLAETSAAIDSINVPVQNWAKTISWTVMELQTASKSGNWDLVETKERARKKDWELGIQRIAFLGSKSNAAVKGLLNQTSVNSNTTLITKYISAMSASEFNTFIQGIVNAYRKNANFTAQAAKFIMPELDYNGLTAPTAETYFGVSKLEYLQNTLRTMTGNPNFKVLPCFYADQVNNTDVTGLNKNRYVMMSDDIDAGSMEIPVDYTSTIANTVNGIQFQNGAYGQFTGVNLYRPLETLYFDWAPA